MKILVSVIFGGIITAVVAILSKITSVKSKQVKDLQSELEKKEIQTEALNKHVSEVTKIKDDENEISKKISKAESEEDVKNVLSDIIAANNNRVHNNQTDKSKTTRKTTKKGTSKS